jgi:hypothetical protein
MTIPLVNKEDVVISRSRDKTTERPKEKENVWKTVVKKKIEKSVRILRIKYYEKMSLPFMGDGRLEYVDAFAVNRGLEDLLKALGYNTKTKGTITAHDCIVVEKGGKMGVGNKFLFVDIGINDFYTLKKQMENYTTMCAFNHGEFMILDGKRSSLTETYDIPKTVQAQQNDRDTSSNMSHSQLALSEILKNELKGIFKPYHLYEDDQIDRMKEPELVHLKKLASRKMEIEKENRKFYKDLLK